MDQRGPVLARPDPGSFRCLVCQEYVRGTDTGHCPRCAYVPPSAPSAQDPPDVWNLTVVLYGALVVGVVVVISQLL